MRKNLLQANAKYSIDAVVLLIKQTSILEELRFKGDLTASDILIDLQEIIKKAKPTKKQLDIMKLVWIDGYTLEEVGAINNTSHQAVAYNLELLKGKIKKVLDSWRD